MRGITNAITLLGIALVVGVVFVSNTKQILGSEAWDVSSLLSTTIASAKSSKIMDYLIQDVCLDSLGRVMPVDPASTQCKSTRNLRHGEGLPYHKHDLKGNDTNPAAAQGYQRSDSFPIKWDLTQTVSTMDFGVGGATFGTVDASVDGYNLYELRGDYASIYATKDPTGLAYFVSPSCVNGNGSEDAWGLFPTTASGTGAKVFSLMLATSSKACPKTFDKSYTAWEFPGILTYTNGVKLDSAISYHYSHPTTESSDHLEKFFFTKKYGMTRWERWERPNTPYHTDEAARSAAKEATGVCNGPWSTTDSIGTWYRVDCREWTMIIPEEDPELWRVPKY